MTYANGTGGGTHDGGDEAAADFEARSAELAATVVGGEEERVDIPPAAIASEAAVLAHALMTHGAAVAMVDQLTPDHFYSEPHRQIFTAIRTLILAGRPAQTPHVLDELSRTHRLRQVGETYLVEVIRWASEAVSIEKSVEHLDDLLKRRRFIESCREFLAHGYLGAEPTTELLDRAQSAVVALAAGLARRDLPVLGGAALSESLPDLPYLVPALGIAPGAPVLVAGYGYSRKTLAAQALLLAVAAGRLAWGIYTVRQGAVLHLDYEQGRRLTTERYQRLARGMGVDLAELPIEVAALPDMHIDARGAEAILLRACRGKALVLIDSLRAAAPSADENSSDIRSHVDMLGRISEKTGATIVIIHHAKKPSKDDTGGAKYTIRGSGALFDACSGIFVFVGEKGQPTVVHHEKERNRGVTAEDFGIDAEDLPDPESGRPNWGLRVSHLDAAQVAEADPRPFDGAKASRFSATCEKVIQFLVANPGAGKRHVRESVEGAKDTIDAAIDALLRAQKLEDRRTGRGSAYHVV